MEKVAIVTGGSSGIGLETAKALSKRGCRVFEFSRRNVRTEGVEHIPCDVSDEAQVAAAISAVLEKTGRIDILVNNAGFGISGAAEFTDNTDAKRLLDVNLFGCANCCKAVIPVMRNQGGGTIVNISSVAGSIAIPFQAWYSVSKAAVSAYSSALLNEVRPFGIRVSAVLPGDIASGFTAAREKSPVGDDVYAGRIARSVRGMERDEENGMRPEKAGAMIANIALKRYPKAEYSLGSLYQFLVVLARLLPVRLKHYIVGLLYAR